MAIKNKLNHFMLWRGRGTAALTEAMQDGQALALAAMEQGQCLPTKSDLEAICSVLRVKPTDIWAEDDLDLLGLLTSGNGRQHGDQTEYRCWVEREFKRKLDIAIRQLGYKTSSAWFRKIAELTIKSAAKRLEKKGL